MKCDIIIPVWDQLELTRDCIENLVKNTKCPYRLILVDNASDGDTAEYLDSVKADRSLETVLVRNEENLGFVKAVNQGLNISTAPYVCILNNDIIPAPGWLERMIEFAEAHDDVGLMNPQCGGHGDMSIEKYAGVLAKNNRDKYMEMNQCQGFCMLVKRELIDKIGCLDESFGIGGFDDTDYSMRAHNAGYKSVSVHDAYVYHRLHASFNKAGNREEWVRRNQKIYYDKWGKHLRLGVAVSLDAADTAALSHLVEFVYGLAREWSWVHIWINFRGDENLIKKSIEDILARDKLPPHQNIRIAYFNLPGLVFQIVIAGKLMERIRSRMRDKMFDAVLTADERLGRFIAPIARILNAGASGISLNDRCDNWESKGKELALVLKGRARRHE